MHSPAREEGIADLLVEGVCDKAHHRAEKLLGQNRAQERRKRQHQDVLDGGLRPVITHQTLEHHPSIVADFGLSRGFYRPPKNPGINRRDIPQLILDRAQLLDPLAPQEL